MEVAALSLCVLMSILDSVQTRASLAVTPDRSQFFKYERFSIRCDSKEDDGEIWSVMKQTLDGEMIKYSSSWSTTDAFPATDSGLYWCETEAGRTSTEVNITVTAGPVILESPVRPVAVGENVTLQCRSRHPLHLQVDFYKDGIYIASSISGALQIYSVSESNEGLYRCEVAREGTSAGSWLSVTDEDTAGPQWLVFSCLRLLIVGSPYLLSTILLGVSYRDTKRGLQASENTQPSDDVIMQIAV